MCLIFWWRRGGGGGGGAAEGPVESEDLVDGGSVRGAGIHECVMTLTC